MLAAWGRQKIEVKERPNLEPGVNLGGAKLSPVARHYWRAQISIELQLDICQSPQQSAVSRKFQTIIQQVIHRIHGPSRHDKHANSISSNSI